jgi:hypothetical protein
VFATVCLLMAGCTGGSTAAAGSAASTLPSPDRSSLSPSVPGLSASASGSVSASGSAVTSTPKPPITPPTTRPQITPPAPVSRSNCATPAACGFPNASSTGTRLQSLAPHSGDIEVHTDGQVISGWDLHGSLDIYANDVTVVDSRITSTNWWGVYLRQGHSGLKVLHSTIVGSVTKGPDNGGTDYGVSNSGSGGFEVGWCDISQFGADVASGHGDVHDNYTHDQANFVNLGHEWVHTDSVISGGADKAGLVVRHNTLINQTPLDKGASASVGLFPDDGAVTNVTVDDNWLAGGAYAFYGGDAGAAGIRVTNNVFSTEISPNGGFYGFVAHWNAGGPGNVWTGNRTPTGTPVTPQG